MTNIDRTAILTSLGRLWRGHSDLRFGQVLRLAVGDAACRPHDIDDVVIIAGLARALRENPGAGPPNGPYWDTESRGDGTFIHGQPRDPARIPRMLEAIA